MPGHTRQTVISDHERIKEKMTIKEAIKFIKTRREEDTDQYGVFSWKNYFQKPGLCIVCCVVLDIMIFLAIRAIFAIITMMAYGLRDFMHFNQPDYVSVSQSFGQLFFTVSVPAILYVVCLVICIVLDIKIVITFLVTFQNLNIGQKGDQRWTTAKEIAEQYAAVPEKDWQYKGYGGFPISWDNKKNLIYVDTTAVNNLVAGTTRSGKGETVVFPTMDIYSRGTEIPSMVIGDPKIELYKGSYHTLTSRGITCMCLNLSSPTHSAQFNPLHNACKMWEKGLTLRKKKDISADEFISAAEGLVDSFSASVFTGKSNGDPYWTDSGTAMLSAMIMQLLVDTHECEDILEEKLKYSWDARKKRWESQSPERQADILKSMRLMTDYEILFNTHALPPDAVFPEQELNLSTQYATKEDTFLDMLFKLRPLLDKAKSRFSTVASAKDVTKASIYSTFSSKMKTYSSEPVARMTCRSSFDMLDFGFGNKQGKKPIALFYSTPDYDPSLNILASTFIEQLYFILAKEATENTDDGKCSRKVVFLLDEFGNLPPISGMEEKITVCLGRNIHFDMFIQGFNQLKEKYGENVAETIKGNCGNIFYLKSGDNATNKDFSEMIGEHTIKTASISGSQMSLKKSVTESFEAKPLISPAQLKRLKMGENVVHRIMKTSDNNGEDIEQFPILNKGNSRFKPRYKYLADEFQVPFKGDVPFENTTSIDLEEYRFDIVAFWEAICDTMDQLTVEAENNQTKLDETDNPEIMIGTLNRFVEQDIERRKRAVRDGLKQRAQQQKARKGA